MPRFQHDSSMVDQMTRLKLKLLKKRLEHKKHNMDGRAESAQSARSYWYDGQLDQLHRALRRKQDLLQRLREQYMLEDLNRPHTWGGSQRQYKSHFYTAPQPPPPLPFHQPAPALPFLPPPPPAPPQPPRIIQQTLPQQPATIIQQLPQQQPLITQIPPPQPYPAPAPRSGSIKEDMVELMLMQNAQMHQIIMHNMMLKAMPSVSPPGGPNAPLTTYLGQDSYQGNPIFVRPDVKPRGSAVHHHHHYAPAAPQLPPICHPTWLPTVSSVPAGQAGAHLPSVHHDTATFTLPTLNV
ncbi:uncharacterized protein C21orf58 homolog [Epinephelus lanceolatus]|uniref:uncharacterized protein C21orf58 n=1 Tax=Epinephelus lanceolatus TaxID=310571 RepID=UPI00144778DD|nr:uncharacterized protein C21orf58 [Epinephelus lanceolatus]XP_033498138.1 uncharacterized protein C21orf58 [Epinephelus lanceolatus]